MKNRLSQIVGSRVAWSSPLRPNTFVSTADVVRLVETKCVLYAKPEEIEFKW